MDWEQVNRVIDGFTTNFNTLGTNLSLAARKIEDSSGKVGEIVKSSSNELTDALNDLNAHIVSYSKSSERQATAMMYLTAALVFVGILQVVVSWILANK